MIRYPFCVLCGVFTLTMYSFLFFFVCVRFIPIVVICTRMVAGYTGIAYLLLLSYRITPCHAMPRREWS